MPHVQLANNRHQILAAQMAPSLKKTAKWFVGKLIRLGCFHLERGSNLTLKELAYIQWMGFIFLPAEPNLASLSEFTSCFIHWHRISHALQWPYGKAIHWSYHFLHHLQDAGPVEQGKGPMKQQLRYQLANDALERWRIFPQNVVSHSKSMTLMVLFSQWVQHMGPGTKGWKQKWLSLLSLSITHLKNPHSFLLTLYSTGLEILVPRRECFHQRTQQECLWTLISRNAAHSF